MQITEKESLRGSELMALPFEKSKRRLKSSTMSKNGSSRLRSTKAPKGGNWLRVYMKASESSMSANSTRQRMSVPGQLKSDHTMTSLNREQNVEGSLLNSFRQITETSQEEKRDDSWSLDGERNMQRRFQMLENTGLRKEKAKE